MVARLACKTRDNSCERTARGQGAESSTAAVVTREAPNGWALMGRLVHLGGDPLGVTAGLRGSPFKEVRPWPISPSSARPRRCVSGRCSPATADLTSPSRKSATLERSGSPRSTNPSRVSSPTTGQTPRTSATSPLSTGTPSHRWTSSAAGSPAKTCRLSGRWPAWHRAPAPASGRIWRQRSMRCNPNGS